MVKMVLFAGFLHPALEGHQQHLCQLCLAFWVHLDAKNSEQMWYVFGTIFFGSWIRLLQSKTNMNWIVDCHLI
jgi:hypothetical protein